MMLSAAPTTAQATLSPSRPCVDQQPCHSNSAVNECACPFFQIQKLEIQKLEIQKFASCRCSVRPCFDVSLPSLHTQPLRHDLVHRWLFAPSPVSRRPSTECGLRAPVFSRVALAALLGRRWWVLRREKGESHGPHHGDQSLRGSKCHPVVSTRQAKPHASCTPHTAGVSWPHLMLSFCIACSARVGAQGCSTARSVQDFLVGAKKSRAGCGDSVIFDHDD